MEKSVLFNTELEALATEYLTKDGALSNSNRIAFLTRLKIIQVDILENLLFYDKICFKVYGENIPLAILLNIFGLDNLYKLIDQDAIEFMLWTPMVVYPIENIEGITPLASGNFTSEAQSIPEVSIKLGFHWLSNDPGVKTRKKLTKLLVDKYKKPSKDIVHNVTNLSWSAYQANEFSNLGLVKKDPMALNESDKKKLCNLTTNVVETAVIAQSQMIAKNSYLNTKLLLNAFGHVKEKIKLDTNILELNRIENIPNIKEMIIKNQLTVDNILEIRKHGEAKSFREWLNNQTYNKKTINIAQEYITAITNPKGIFNKPSGKIGKTIFCYSLGLGISSLFSGPLAPIVGIPIGTALDVGSNLGFSMFDTFLLSSLTSGWTPKIYLDKIKEISKEKNV